MIKPVSRLAENTDGEAIKALLVAQSAQFDASIPFDDINPFWIVAELPDRGIVGCIQTCPSRPFGHLEMLAWSNALSEIERGLVVRELVLQGSAVLNGHRAVVVAGFVPFELKGYKRVLKKRGSKVADSGNMMMRRIA